jgi:hypothetical protein
MISRKLLSLAAVTGLEGGCIAAILLLGGMWLRIESPRCEQEADVARTPLAANALAPSESSRGDATIEARRTVAAAHTVEPVDEPVRPVRSRRTEHSGEADLYTALMAKASDGPTELEREARLVLNREGPVYGKVAALRAVWDSGSSETAELFADAIARQPDVSDARSESVPRFALTWLAQHAPRSETAREVLERIAWPRDLAISADLRRVAAEGLAAAADEAELARIAGRLQAEPDRAWAESVARALARNPNTRSADASLWRSGFDPAALRRADAEQE